MGWDDPGGAVEVVSWRLVNWNWRRKSESSEGLGIWFGSEVKQSNGRREGHFGLKVA